MLIYDETTGEWVEEEIPEAPPDVHVPTIKGYGTRVVMDKDPGQWITAGGAEAPDEYVRDIDETINAVDTGRISEADLSRRIARQEGLPSWSGVRAGPPPRPSDTQLSHFEKRRNFIESVMPDIEEQAQTAAEEAKQRRLKARFGWPSDRVLLKPEQASAYEAEAEGIYQSVFNHTKDGLVRQYDSYATEQLRIEEEQRRNTRELAERQTEAERKRAEKIEDEKRKAREKAEEKIDDRTKEYLKTLRSEQGDIGKELRGIKAQLSKYGVANPDIVPPTLAKNELIVGMVNQYRELRDSDAAIEGKINEVIFNKPSEARDVARRPVTERAGQEKTVTIDGKKYKDGDIVEKDGKKYRVRIKR